MCVIIAIVVQQLTLVFLFDSLVFVCYYDFFLSANKQTLPDTTELELELKAKEKEVTCLLEDVERLQDNLKQLRETSTKQIALLEKQFKDNNQKLTVYEAKLKTQADYEEIKKELRWISGF